jgi:hypothetical protein
MPVYASEGLRKFSQLDGPIRGLLNADLYIYVVAGEFLWRVTPEGFAEKLHRLDGHGPATLARNRVLPEPEIAITSGGVSYIWRATQKQLVNLSGKLLANASSVDYVDGRFLWAFPDGRFQWSAIDDGTSIDGLAFATAEGHPDGLIRAFCHKRDVWLFGPQSIEIWQGTGDREEVFRRSGGAVLPTGCASGAAIVDVHSSLFWISDDGIVLMASGYQGQRVSTHPVERAIEQTKDRTTIEGCTWARAGHVFYAISTESWTWVYDLSTQQWHERQSYGLNRWRVRTVEQFQGDQIAGDYANGKLYKLDQSYGSEDGAPIQMIMQTPMVHAFPERLRFDTLYCDVIPGVGLNEGRPDEVSPELVIRWSDDGGHSWGTERRLPMGDLGERQKRIRTHRLGATREDGRVFRLEMASDVVRGVIALSADVTKLRA